MSISNVKYLERKNIIYSRLQKYKLFRMVDKTDPNTDIVRVTNTQLQAAAEQILADLMNYPDIMTEHIEIVVHYNSDDTNFEGDYVDVEIKNEQGAVMGAYGSQAVESGRDAAKGFIKGVEYAMQRPITTKITRIADR